MIISVKKQDGSTFDVEIDGGQKVEALQELIQNKTSIITSEQRLVFSGRVLQPDKSLTSYNVDNNCVVYLLHNRPNSQASSSMALASSNDGELDSRGDGRNPADRQNRGFRRQVYQQFLQNPSAMQQMLNSPIVQQLLSSPQVMQSIIQANPQINELMQRNPELSQMLTDPQVLQQSVAMLRSPNLMREVMRNTDRAMNNLEATPGGYNALLRMYNTIQEPIWNATIDGNAAAFASNQSNNTSPSYIRRLIVDNEVMPNPWSNSSSSAVDAQASAADSTIIHPSTAQTIAPTPPNVINDHAGGLDMENSFSNFLSDPNFRLMMSVLGNQSSELQPTQSPSTFQPPTSDVAMQAMGMALSNWNLGSTNGAGITPSENVSTPHAPPIVMRPTASSQSPEERWRFQLEQLRSMGFNDTEANLAALIAADGNVNRALDALIQMTGTPTMNS
eukprot:GHVL01009036.1.p1 GENE.GHVL01009036.1~~GHVL01009036.1.p1  ORF type:complete len:447 (+),score=71.65 GHVL01009036.1:101-1441(+)